MLFLQKVQPLHEILLKYLEEKEEKEKDAVTVREIAEATGFHILKVRALLRDLIKEGKVVATRKVITDISGKRVPSPAYRFIGNRK